MFMRWLLVLVLSVVSADPALAQLASLPESEAATDPARSFDEAAAEHVGARRRLGATRGFSPEEVRISSLAHLTHHLRTSTPAYPAGTAVLFYAHKNDKLAIFLVGIDGIIAHHVVTISSADLRLAGVNYRIDLDVDGIARSRAPVWTGSGGPSAPVPVVSSSHAGRNTPIAEILLPPTIRKALLDVRHLVIVAGGVIATNPFAAFPLTGDEVLIDRMSVTVSAGLFDLDQMLRPWRGRSEYGNMLVVGDPRVPTTPEWRVPPLPGAASEAALLAERAAVPALLGEAATKAAVLDRMGSARLLYFAAHGVSDPRAPLSGGFLMLAGPSPDEAFLTAGEVQQMRLQASLVVLSACQSGLGFAHDGGVIGLARAFQKAGVPRVVMSLWSVSDEATLYLLDRFQLAAMNNPPAEALRLAMLDTRQKYPDPALWAPFTLFGTPR
jgi:hypothetical protein